MRAVTIVMRGLAWIIIAMLVIPPGLPAQDAAEPEQPDSFKKEELTQMLAPIALYPDSLIAQILMASTYPLEVVEAERWLLQNKNLKGDELDNALQDKPWDPSVKSLCHFPDLLMAMSDKLDQTRKLGDAFLSQEEDVMATIQELRKKAQDNGNLKTTREQQVIVEREIIRIEPAEPEVVYVPVYDPLYVYGPWWYPAYPPYYWYYPPGYYYAGGFIGFGPRIFIGIGWFSWSWFDWPVRVIHIDINKTKRFHKHRDRRDIDRRVWKHDPAHRKGVAYRDSRTSTRFGVRPSRLSPGSPERRGYPDRRIERRDGRPSQGVPLERRERTVSPPTGKGPEREPGPVDRRERTITPPERRERGESRGPVERREAPVTPRERPRGERIKPPSDRDTPFRGIGEGSFERKAGERGGESRRSIEIRPQRGDTGRQGRSGGASPGGGRGGGPRR
jgi:hypothetical protein